ncbi:Uncharacterised protein [Bordetella pertussis]|nr:Uncharacterised protein [Bordetella pertussis]CFO79695.1 Uncharacterised protein [Bordetella pertussis]CFU83063.1 Uncharacterised protein [Bordetella pertussis]CFW04960.1 Uncharacterised protein [Bordetella pertussis]CPI78285.1 Uncharacterised protein [Bordetella pertussis]
MRQNSRNPRDPRLKAASSIDPSMLRSATTRFIRMNGK